MPTKSDVRFNSSGLQLAGHLYTPDSVDGRAPAIVVSHPLTGVKEQTSSIYARALAEQGFVTLAFDAAYQGESEGEPRGLENPFQRAEDVRNAVTYLSTRDEVDPERIGALGICASGGYVPYAAQTDHRIRAVATVSAADGAAFFKQPDPEGFAKLVAQAGAARIAEATGEEIPMVPVLPDSVDDSTPPSVAEFFDYYRTPRGQHPRSIGKYVLRSADQLDQFDAFADVAKIAPRPLLMIAGTAAVTKPFSDNAVAAAGDNAELYEVEGATHVDLYDVDKYVSQALDQLVPFFRKNLAR
ncbi:alpha/beta hydrolase [Nocardia sp. NPDC050378]|uniref:alpha/beta hydrolase n=1 Tax=Nocardia sp. NPDC050378 TaxID=3155400 RepID=UPI0033F450B1